ncbi:MAG: glycosyltransferase, partial [Clostridia bacterium]|nr:glycosyltransferase [Clostridia bacterium]
MTIIIPAYKPDEKLIALLHDLKKSTDARLLIINDGSGEAFEPIFDQVRSLGVTLLVHPQNKGKGAALKTAFQYLLDEGRTDEVICTADADGQHLPKDILR